jgi:hypothetical protein
MKIIISILLVFGFAKISFSQDSISPKELQKKFFNNGKLKANSTSEIAEYVKSNFDKEEDKVRAAYSWVITNISYDTDSARIINAGIDPDAKITVAFKRRKGVCENFAAIFNDICVRSGITSFVIDGYTKQGGRVDKIAHSWCAASIDNKWYLFDPTWDAGSRENFKFFMVPPEEFIESHMPFDPLWQLLNHPISHEQFYTGNYFANNKISSLNFSDSVAAYIQMDSLQRLQSTEYRIQKFGLYNSRINENYAVVKMNIEIANQDKELESYNSAIESLNDATTILNNFIEYRNNKFIPEKPDGQMAIMLDNIDNKIIVALKKLNEVDQSQARLVLGTQPAREKLDILSKKIEDQKRFLKLFLTTAKNERNSVFY